MRVLMVAPTPFFADRGCHVRIYEEVRALQRLGVQVTVATYPTGRDPEGFTVRRTVGFPGAGRVGLGPSWLRFILDPLLTLTALRVARRERPDLVHAHLHEGIAVGAVLRRRLGLPLVADLQGSLTGELVDHGFISGRGLRTLLARGLERALVRRPDVLLVSSEAGRQALAAQGARPERIVPLPDGVDVETFHPWHDVGELRRELGLEGKRVVVFLGVLTPYQGVNHLLQAMWDVVRMVPRVHLLLMGYPNVERYRTMVRAFGLGEHVTVTGRIDYREAPRWLCLGQVAVSPKLSATEANGKLVNYMAAGLPVVVYDSPVARELLGEEGRYVPPGDVSGLARALVELLGDEAEAQRLGKALRARAERAFAWPVLAHRLLGVYQDLRTRARR
ncbi:MAG: glycosyltransferase family 4 protein [Candidatus Rokubacteria bacterium]|nr:glycosyltransferase family 4 protein [Candidatus Rokubacteria bacterium]